MGSHRLSDVTHAGVAAWVAQLRAKGSAPATARQAHRAFSLLLGLAVRDGRIPRNPADRVPVPGWSVTSHGSSPMIRWRLSPTRPLMTET
jgi:hypothetical protein